jgi:hypothetical protein
LAPENSNAMAPADVPAEKAVLDILRNGVMRSEPRDISTLHPRKMGANTMALRDAAAQASRQRALLARALRANETDDKEGGRKSGRLDRGALPRAMANCTGMIRKDCLTDS